MAIAKKQPLPKSLVEGLIDYHFNPNSWSDGYTMNSWRGSYGQEMIDRVEKEVIKPMRKERAAVEKKLAAITKKYVTKYAGKK